MLGSAHRRSLVAHLDLEDRLLALAVVVEDPQADHLDSPLPVGLLASVALQVLLVDRPASRAAVALPALVDGKRGRLIDSSSQVSHLPHDTQRRNLQKQDVVCTSGPREGRSN